MKVLIAHWNNVLNDIEKTLWERGHTILENIKFLPETDVLVLWNEVERSGRPIIRMAQGLGKKVVLIQHGRGETIRLFPPFNERLLSDKCCVWGEGEKERMIKVGTPAESIEVTGCPLLKHLKPREKHEGKNVVFCADHWDMGETKENLIVAKELRKLKGVNIISKILEKEHDPTIYDNPVASNRNEPGHLDIMMGVLARTDLVVGISESTFEALAEVLDIPVVIADIWTPRPCAADERYLKYNRKKIYTNASKKAKLKDLNQVILQQLKYPNELKRKRKKISIENMGTKFKDPVGNIVKVIENI